MIVYNMLLCAAMFNAALIYGDSLRQALEQTERAAVRLIVPEQRQSPFIQ